MIKAGTVIILEEEAFVVKSVGTHKAVLVNEGGDLISKGLDELNEAASDSGKVDIKDIKFTE